MSDQPNLGLEVWMIGKPDELDAAALALRTAGLARETSPRTPLKGEDNGRFSVFVRMHMRAGAPKQAATVRKNARRPAQRRMS